MKIPIILTCQKNFPNKFIPTNSVKIHHLNINSAISDLLPGHIKFKTGIENGIQIAFVDWRLLLLNSFVAKHQPNFHIGI